ncbi:gamma-glutamyltransferase [Undibacterium arcticum]
MKTDAGAAAYFYQPDGQPKAVGTILKKTLTTPRRCARSPPAAPMRFYKGRIAKDIETKVKSHPTNPGGLTAQDIAGYQAKQRAPICSDYKAWTVCGMPPPSSGGIAIAQMLGMLETKDIRAYAPQNGALSAGGVHLFFGSRAAGLCRSRPLRGRYRFRAAAGQ